MVKIRSTRPYVLLSVVVSVFLTAILLFTGWIAGAFKQFDAEAYKAKAAEIKLPDYMETAIAQVDDKGYWREIDERKAKKLEEAKALDEEKKRLRKTQEPRHFFPPKDISATEPVDDSYFNDALFIGDSLQAMLYYANEFPNSNFFATVNLSYENLDQPFVIQSLGNQEGVILDLLEANRGQYSKVYSLLGINNVNYSSDISSVKTYFEQLREYFPDATIYIESIFPTTETGLVEAGKSNEVIKEYNAKVYELCQEFGYHYLDVASVMMDKDGRLPEGLARDGIHFEDFSAVRDYIYTHTVTEQE